MASSRKGKFFTPYLLFIFALLCILRVFANSNSVPIENEHVIDHKPDSDALSILNRHQIQLEKLEELVKNLSELVSRLDSRFSESPKLGPLDEKHNVREKIELDARKFGDGRSVEKIEDDSSENKVRDGVRGKAVSVTKYSPFWSERFQFVSAVKLDSDANCINVLPFRDYEGLSKYVAVGDDRGRVYVFLRNGDVSVEFYTMSDSPITAMLSYLSVYKNESVMVTGHKNGLILVHRVWEVSHGEEWSSLSVENVGKFASPEIGEGGSPITILEVHHVGRMRYILSADLSGKMRVFRENGTVYGLAVPTSRPLVFLKQRLLFLTESGAGSLDLRTMKVRESECEGLNHSVARNYVFDATERSKAYGFTSDGDLIHVLLLGDIMNFKCRVRSKRKFDMDEPLAFQAIKGFLLIVNQQKVFVYNVSSQHYARVGGPRLLFSAGLDDIRSSFLNYQSMDIDDQRSGMIPLLASDREKLVILGLGGGYVGMYRSNLPVFKGEFNTMLWTSPVFFFIVFLFGAWQFFAKKKEALTSWGPDDPFSSTTNTNGAPLGSGPGDRSFTDSTRSADIMDSRSGSLRGPPRRYVSPSRYPGGATSSFRPSSADTNSRPTSVDPNFRTASELKFRGSNLESTELSITLVIASGGLVLDFSRGIMVDLEDSSLMGVSTASAEASISPSGNPTTAVAMAKKKRNLPGMPDPDAEVIALSPKTLMATNRFVCEICSKGFQRDQNLQLHRRGHNLPWKLRQRTSKEVRKRVYVCPEPTCVHHEPSRALGDLTGIKKHFCRKHGEKKWKCERCSKKYAVQSDLKAHMKACGTREYRCDCGTLFSRRDSFITHRAFCDALAQESARTQTQAIPNSEGSPKVQTVASSSSSPPPPPLTPSTGVLSPVLSIQSSELVENQTGLSQLQPPATGLTTTSAISGGSTSSGNGSGGGGVFASVFASSTPAGLTQSSQSPSSYSDLLCAMSSSENPPTEHMFLSLSSSFYLSSNTSSLFPAPGQEQPRHYAQSQQPVLSATALLQKAAQMGATGSNSSFLRGLGLAMPSSLEHQGDTSATTMTTTQWNSNVKQESKSLASELGLGLPSDGTSGLTDPMMGPSSSLFGNQPTTLDLLGLGIGASGTSTVGLSAFFTSIGDGVGVAAASAAFGGDNWEGPSETKPSLL
ncbi:hypothetical protein F0562_035985 [Nyssa sinensis]|uniref:C2H2-type domain-containing protein n=1 Tax=Nyssa sinensis TaxID=561372 RepID=A0A5J5ADB7_9ASTE|nr:hypothetical protein F0562_035985 [Nyssa sinensis]